MKKKKFFFLLYDPKLIFFTFENWIIMRESDWLKLLRPKNKTGFQRKKKRTECNFLNLGLKTEKNLVQLMQYIKSMAVFVFLINST